LHARLGDAPDLATPVDPERDNLLVERRIAAGLPTTLNSSS